MPILGLLGAEAGDFLNADTGSGSGGRRMKRAAVAAAVAATTTTTAVKTADKQRVIDLFALRSINMSCYSH